MPAAEMIYLQIAAQHEVWMQAEFDRCVNTSHDEPPTRSNLRSLCRAWGDDAYYALYAAWRDTGFTLDTLDLRAACYAGISAGIVTVRKANVVEAVS